MRAGAVHGPDPFVRYSPAVFGLAFAAAMPAMRRRIADNLVRAQGSAPLVDIARVFTGYASSLTEAFAVGSGRSERLVAEIVGDDHYLAAKAHGRGVIVATAHTSGWYAAGPVLASVYDEDVIVVMQRERDEKAQEVQHRSRTELGMRVVHVGDDPLAAMPLLAHLRKGGVVALQMDRVVGAQRARQVRLLGGSFQVPEGALLLAALSGAPIVLVVGRRLGFLRYEIAVSDSVMLPRRPSPDELDRAAQHVADRIEAFVKSHPLDWFHFVS